MINFGIMSSITTAVIIAIVAILYTTSSSDDVIKVDLLNKNYLKTKTVMSPVESKAPPKNIAVVGGGIAGSTASLFLRSLFGEEVAIDLYEPSSSLCGRVASAEISGEYFESGGSILHPKNYYSSHLMNKFGLTKAEKDSMTIGFFDGETYDLITSSNRFINFFKMLWHFGLDLFKIFSYTSGVVKKFSQIYDFQNQGKAYNTVEDLLLGLGGSFYESTQKTACQLFNEIGLDNHTINLLVNGAIKVNYGQDCNSNGLAGSIAMAGMDSGTWSVRGGNRLLCEKSVVQSAANHLQFAVDKIKYIEENSTFKISFNNFNNHKVYDLVILSVPFYFNGPNIDVTEACDNNCPTVKEDKRYRQTVATFVKGQLNKTTFKCNECSKTIIATKDMFYRSISLRTPVNYLKNSTYNPNVYKIFSTEKLTSSQLDELFENHSIVKSVVWKAYPRFNPPEQFDSFVLNTNGLYYTSAFEWAASTIETSIISSKNSALLAFNKWYGLV